MAKKVVIASLLVLCSIGLLYYRVATDTVKGPCNYKKEEAAALCLLSTSSISNQVEVSNCMDFVSMFKNQALESLNENALVTEETSVSYGELDKLSDALASYLRGLGVEKGDFIGLSSLSDEYFIIGVLGILKSGGVYLPLDPAYPGELIDYIVSDARPKIILAKEEFKHLFSKFSMPILDLKAAVTDKPIENKDCLEILGSDPAYVVYTSGSTGNPKGIVVMHKSLPNIGISHRSFYPTKTNSLISGGICFDASILAIFHSLLNGGCLYLSNFGADQNIEKLCNFIDTHPINYMICVPSLYRRILEGSSKLDNLRCVSLTGEMIPNSLCLLHAEKSANAFLYNEYGPTECAIGTSIKKIYDPSEKVFHRVTVGRPLVNTKVYILDDNLNICPIGAKGEICVEGIGLAKGYLNNKELTQKSFIDISLDGRSKVRLYKTGDLGRYADNGELEFLGRKTHQVVLEDKVVYIGEIEGAIYSHPDVIGAIVVKEEGSLVAYVTCTASTSSDMTLENFLDKSLPSFMVPTRIIRLESFPLSPNGKIDKKALFATRLKGE